ncbi:hypothetical protein HMN09_01199000 [Mycena chlorophos]|uniref:NAD(P)-binding protein n=1 Tax=Mycena chlorophos TaxID=658473 RepID=A0A8H6S5D8_MYCCL|nr:hypothetical protein HMN09_01199000 [Mycena chlorophos]
MSLLCLNGSDVAKVTSNLSPASIQLLMARVFAVLSSGDPNSAHTPHRSSIPMENHLSLFMPARMVSPALSGAAIKIVSVPTKPGDTRGLPASTVVLDEESGAAKAILNAANLTALRNAAGSLLSCNLVGPRQPASLVAFGAGAQIEAHVDLFVRAFTSLKRCTIVNRTMNDRVERLAGRLRTRFPQAEIDCVDHDAANPNASLQSTLLSAHLIICATSSTIPLFPSSWVSDAAHIMLIGSYKPTMHEVDGTLIRRARPLLVDSRDACFVEAGELIAAQIKPDEMQEIGDLVAFESGELFLEEPTRQELAFREGSVDGPVTIFKSVGVGLQDVAIACAVVQQAEEMGLGTRVDWT